MSKAARRKRREEGAQKHPAPARAPYVARPFEGLRAETEWVAMREIVPAAVATVRVRLPDADPPTASEKDVAAEREVTLVTVLPGAVPALHRSDGTVLVAMQSRTHSGDASRDIGQAMLSALAAEPGSAVTTVRPATADTPRMHDLLVDGQVLEPQVQADFSYWVEEGNASPEVEALLEQTNAAAVPTEKIDAVPSAYWCSMSERAYIRWILPDDEDDATTALARLQAAGEHTLGGDSVLLGAFRAAGLLVPVIEVDPQTPSAEHGAALGALAERYAAALAQTGELSPQERRARSGLISRQVTLR